MKSYDQFLNHFFSQNQEILESNYPGINLQFFKTYVEETLTVKRSDFYIGSRLNQIFFTNLINGIPLEHLSGKRVFFRSSFCVGRETLIPRFETETLVELAVKEASQFNEISFIDIGCGTGVIGLSLLRELKNKKIKATLSDFSSDALELAKKNYHKLSYFFPPHDIEFIVADRLNLIKDSFDLILTNPPYIMKEEDELHANVAQFEPELALFLDAQNYFTWFKEFFSQIGWHLNKGGVLLMEGSEKHLPKLLELAKELNIFSELEICFDLTSRERFLLGKK